MDEKLIISEIERIFIETLKDCNQLEKTVIKVQLLKATFLTGQGYPARIHRLVYEVLHRYYCMMEGLEKK